MLRGHARAALAALLACGALMGVPGASNADGCSNEQLRVEVHSTWLPDCRAYELVSPVDKNASDILAGRSSVRASVDGERVTFDSNGSFADSVGSGGKVTKYLASREGGEWSTHSLMPAQAPKQAPSILGARYFGVFSEDLSKGALLAYDPSPDPGAGAPAGVANIYVRDNLTGSYQLASRPAVPGPITPELFYQPIAAAATQDMSHVLIESSKALAPGATEGVTNLFESVDGELRLAGVLPDGEPASSSQAGRGAGFQGTIKHLTEHTISTDGSKVFFQSPAEESGGETGGDLYVRIDGTHTLQINSSERATPDPRGALPGTLMGESADGERAFFITSEQLTDDDLNETSDLYAYDVDAPEGHHLTLISSGLGGEAVSGAVVSADGSHAYFVVGAEGASQAIYVWEAGRPGSRELADISADAPGSIFDNWFGDDTDNALTEVRVTPDGRYLLFPTESNVTSYDAHGVAELYLYDADSERPPVCVSCDPSGAAPVGSPALSHLNGSEGFNYPYLTNDLSADGQRVFFDTPDALVPADVNGLRDVYEWENGAVHLISRGDDGSESLIGDASTKGDDVFFLTRDQLVSEDQDDNMDLYDARVDGGIPGQDEPSSRPSCSGEDCQGPPSTPPTLAGGVTSATLATGSLVAPTPRAASSAKPRAKKPKSKKKLKRKPKKVKKPTRKTTKAAHERKVLEKSGRRSQTAERGKVDGIGGHSESGRN